jgi:outer membrane biosynthesis protein TonB
VKPQPQPPEQKPLEENPLPPPPQPEVKEPVQITPPAPKKAPPRPAPKKRNSPAPAAPQPPQPAEQPQVQPLPPPSTPQLGEMLSDNQRRQYEAEYAQSLLRARAALRQASGKSLTQTQKETVERIGTFIRQAEESKGKDLATALQLVRRADVLGQDLLKAFQ